jgi:hypothetical protein
LGEYLDPYYRPITTLGLILIISGLLLIVLPFLVRYLPNIDNIPWILLWVYKSNGFYFATSPILIILSILSILVQFWKK